MKILALLIIISANVNARLGETVQQCQERYGYPSSEHKISEDFIAYRYYKDGISISITFYKNIAIKIFYSKPMDDYLNFPAFNTQGIKTLLNANSQGYSWTEIDLLKKGMETTDEFEKEYYRKRSLECNWVREALGTKDELQRNDYLEKAIKCIWWIRTDGAIAHYEYSYNWLTIEIVDVPATVDTLEGF